MFVMRATGTELLGKKLPCVEVLAVPDATHCILGGAVARIF